MYKLSKELIEILDKEELNYCHWKSNLLLNEALGGYDDLDLLIDRKDISKFESSIFSLGFKEGSNKNISFSAIKHYYGFDTDSGNILHLHVYSQIKTGPSWTKSMRFDFEDYFLENSIFHESGMKIPPKHIEFVLFIIRVMMKYSKINEYIIVEKENKRTPKEIQYLLDGLDKNKLNKFLEQYFPEITETELFNYVDLINKGNFLNRFIVANKLKYKLKRYKNIGILNESYQNTKQFIYRILNKLIFKQKKKLHSSGTLIVIAGLDATGKTTITTELKKWLGKNLTTTLVHFGKPPSTILTFPINTVIKLMRKNSSDNILRSSIKNENSAKSVLYVIRQVVLAYDRYALIKKQWQKTSNGEIVLCDRYKSEDFGVMDSKRLNPKLYTGFKKKLAEFENHLYNIMPKPDILFYLTVPVDVAVQRNEDRIKEGKESENFLRIRHKENKDLIYNAKYQFNIDTNKEYISVITNIKSKIWKII
jgi:thymidylate kinase